MEWFVDGRRLDAVSALRQEVGAYLRRHGRQDSDFQAAEMIFSELLTNVARHAAGPGWVRLEWSGERPRVEIHDLGPGFTLDVSPPVDPTRPGGRGLFLVSQFAQELAVAAKRAGGSRVSAVLPVLREAQRSHDAPPRRLDGLPSPEEAAPDGTFGREAFLRALVVELARASDHEAGPDATAAMVAQVGATVGQRMEDEYRRVRGLADRLTPEEIADLYVRLKAAIDGDFYVVEADERRIVLANRRCPFGDAVKHSPGLCRMTSSVFGGIAARNADGASIVLEERIAIGDPECRVTVWLGGPPPGDSPGAHRYEAPVAAG